MSSALGDATHECPAEGCERRVARSMLACRKHWARVSRTTQAEVYAAYRSGDATRHWEAMQTAIAEMNGRPA